MKMQRNRPIAIFNFCCCQSRVVYKKLSIVAEAESVGVYHFVTNLFVATGTKFVNNWRSFYFILFYCFIWRTRHIHIFSEIV